jgi:hypothetical protein
VKSFGWKYPKLSLAHTRICTGDKTQYHRHIGRCSPGIKLITGAYYIYSPGVGPSPPYPRRIRAQFASGKSIIPGAYGLYAPGINIPKGRLSRCEPTSQYHWRIHCLCTGDNSVSRANSKLCARGNFTTGESIWGAPAIVLLAISNSLLVLGFRAATSTTFSTNTNRC